MTRLALLLLALLLTACVVDPAYTNDPYSLAQYGAGLQTQADTLLLSTEQAAAMEAHALAMQSTGTAAAWQIQATQTIASGEVAQTNQAQSLAGTAHIVQLAATDNAGRVTQTVEAVHYVATIEAAGATATAIALAVEHEREMLRVRTAWVGVREAAYSLFVVCVLAAAGYGMWRGIPWLAAWMVEWTDRRRSLYETRQGTAVYTDDGVQLLGDIYHSRQRPNMTDTSVPVVTMSANQITAESKTQTYDPITQDALELLRKSNPDGETIVPAGQSGWGAAKWHAAKRELGRLGYVTSSSKGTRVIDGYTVGDVIYALETGAALEVHDGNLN